MQTHHRRGRAREGFTLIEVLIAGVVVAVALTGFAAALIAAHDLRELTRQTTVAMNTVRFVVEEIEALDNFDYAQTHLNGYTFRVPELRSPELSQPFPDGTYPTYYPSATLPPLEGLASSTSSTSSTSSSGGYNDPAMDASQDTYGIGLEASYESTPEEGYGIVYVNQVAPDMLELQVNLEFGTARGNRRIVYTAHLLRPVDPDTWEW